MPSGWVVPVTNPPGENRNLRICETCERTDPFLQGVTNADAGIHATPTHRWTRTKLDDCDHPNHRAAD